MALIDDYITDLANIQRRYEANWVLPYGSAYALAFERFKATLDSQREFDKFKAELFMMAVTLGIGGGLGAMFGKAALRSVVVDQAVNFVCNRNMLRTFNAMAAVASSPAGSFIAKHSWDIVAGMLTNAAKRQVENLVSRSPQGVSTIQNPQVFQNDLQSYLLRTISAAHTVATEVRDNLILNSAAKDEIARELRAARLFRAAPTLPVTGVRENAVKDLELLLYMVLVMDSDYIQETTYSSHGVHDRMRTRRIGAVSQRTTSSDYPTGSSTHSYGLGYVNHTSREVKYDSPGSRVMDRINVLHRERVGSDFQVGGYGRDEVTRAEQLSARLQQPYLRVI